jgi:hypothetical protein
MGDPTSVIVLDNIFVQSIVSTRSWTLPLSMATQGQEQWQIAYPLQIRWKDGDWKSGTAAITTGGGGSSSIPTGTQASSGPTATFLGNSAATSSSSSKLSAGSIAGIVTGSVSAVVGILGFAFKVYKWRHPKPRLNEDGGGEGLKIKNNA